MGRAATLPGTEVRLYPAVFFSSLATLGFEIILVRVFSILLWYHFAFMVVSISMLGLAVSGTALALYFSRRRQLPGPSPLLFPLLGLAFTASYAVAVRIPFDPLRLSWDRGQLLFVTLYYLVLAAPFFVNGLILASAFASQPASSGRIYASDLSGAAAGTVLVVLLQLFLAPGQTVLACSALAAVGGLLVATGLVRLLAALIVSLALAGILLAPPFIEVMTSPYKALPILLSMKGSKLLSRIDSPYGRVDLFESPGVRHAPGLSLRFRGDIPPQLGLSVDGSSVTTVSPGGDADRWEFLDHLPSSFAFEMRGRGAVLLIDPRGGISPHLARRHGAASVTCTESNPAVLRLLEREGLPLAASCGGRVFTGPARTLLAGEGGRFDLIDLSISGTIPSAGQLGGGEDYSLTVEAMRTLMESLKEEGILNVTLFLSPPYRAELRIFTTLLSALEEMGVSEPARHVAVLRSLELLTVLVGRSPFDERHLGFLREFCRTQWFDPLFFHGIEGRETAVHIRTVGEDLAASFAALADPSRRGEFVERYPFDISPTTDDSPYFHDHLRLSTLPEVFRAVDGKWDFFVLEGYLIPLVLIQAAVLGFLLVLLPAMVVIGRGGRGKGRTLLYFAFLGAGYMLVEVGFIQKMILTLEHPVHSVATVVGALLITSGAGSFLSRRWGPGRIWQAALAVGLTVLVLGWQGAPIAATLLALPLPLRILAIFLVLLPPGFLMGTLFPGGLRCLAGGGERVIPWAWAVNGFFSVIAPVAAVMIATREGFGCVLLLGAFCYLGASLSGRGFCTSPTMGTNLTPPI